MSRVGYPYHAEPCYREDWGEAVAICDYNGQNMWDMLSYVVYDVFGRSIDGHRDLILNANELACASHVNNYKLYVTIRGK
jgi:hypothetical protein